MQRYFAECKDNFFIIENNDFHHIVRVMRMNIGDEIYCVNNKQQAALCCIEEITDNEVYAKVVKWVEKKMELPIQVSIVSGLPKGDKLEWIIQKGTELGATMFIPFIAARSIVKWDDKKAEKKIARWNKIAKEAAEQSHRLFVPEVSKPLKIKELLEISKNYEQKIVAYEEEAKVGESFTFAKTLSSMQKDQSLLAVFGPEGGLSESEVAILQENGFKVCGLGPRILRTETAPLYVLAAVSYHFELRG